MAEVNSSPQSATVSVRSKTLAKILRSYKDGKFILQNDHSECKCPSTLQEDLFACGPLSARLARADLMLCELEPKIEKGYLSLTDVQPQTSQPEFALAQIVLGTIIRNDRLRKLLIKAELGQTLSHLYKFEYDLADVKFPLLNQLDAFLESLRCLEKVSATEIKDKGMVQQVFTEEFSDVADSEDGEAEFLLWVERSDVNIEELKCALAGLHKDDYDAEREEKLAETVEALRRSRASEKGLRLKGAIMDVISALRF